MLTISKEIKISEEKQNKCIETSQMNKDRVKLPLKRGTYVTSE